MNMLMNGTSPVGMVYNQSAENIAYSSGVSVKDKIDEITGTQSISDWTTLSSTYGAVYTKVGKIVTICIEKYGAGINTQTDVSLGTLPEGFRPRNTFRQVGYNGEHRVEVASDGNVSVVGNAPNLLFNLTYIASR